MSIQNKLNSRVAVKYNHLQIEETGKIYVDNRYEMGLFFPMFTVKKMLAEGSFSNVTTVLVGGPNGCYGPNVAPSPKAMKRLTSILNGTSYKIVQQKDQTFTIEGVN